MKARTSQGWPSTGGRVLQSQVGAHTSSDQTLIYEPNVLYEYNVSGQVFQSKQISYGAVVGTSSPTWAEGVIAKYPLGGAVSVFYNPRKPSEAVSEHNSGMGNFALM